MRRKLTFIFLTLLLFFTGINQPEKKAHAETNSVTINAPVLNIRKGPGLSYPILQQVKKGDQFIVLQKKSDWYEIKMPSGETGWAASWLVSLNEANTMSEESGTVTVSGLRLRSGPSSDSSILKVLQKDQVVKTLAQNGDWINITVDGMNGWVSKGFLSIHHKLKIQAVTKGIITVDHLNIRTSPYLTSDTIGTLNTGNEVTILEDQNGWIHFSMDNQEGWVSGQYVQKVKSGVEEQKSETKNSNQKMIGSVSVSSLNVRNNPSLDGKIIGSVTNGQSFEIIKEMNNWIEVKLINNQVGWIAGWYVNKATQTTSEKLPNGKTEDSVTILYNGTNLRSDATTNSNIVARGNAGDSFTIQEKVNDWYKIQLSNGGIAFVASWLVSVPNTTHNDGATNISNKNTNKTSTKSTSGLKGKTIVIDPGHGGQDKGTTGYRGTYEKNMTLSTAMKLYQKLKNAGANVILTRSDDHYVSLPARVGISASYHADAFISIHFDSLKEDPSVTGHTTYYYHENQKELANDINGAISTQVSIKDRGVRFADFHVIRENNAPAVLTELGYLSNPNEELLINSEQYQELLATGIYNGFVQYFK